jgi:hypothetical protein
MSPPRELSSEQLALMRAIDAHLVTWRRDGQLAQDRGADRLSNRFGIVTARVIDLEAAGLVAFHPTATHPGVKGPPYLTGLGRIRLRAAGLIS